MGWTEKEQQDLDKILKKYPPDRKLSAVLPALYLAQREKNWLDDDDIEAVADALGIETTHVHSIIGFYTLFRKEPVGKYMMQVCTDLPCALRGAEDFFKRLCERMGLGPHGGTTEDNLFTVEEVVCIAACDKAPCMQINLEFFESLTDEQIDEVVARLRAEAS
ncbi:MAG: NAD(P)H-dependent oxidoreductase subunit E [Anaerolineae bacterium]|nr:NAD(P)H-dependent oxidoreductase subunit E [Anaerolineae bacterium]MCB0178883.1 NAD(P)H-dependent oxidoreductase subunit E [Anaerolineae bacterium]MCB9105448.1 NAD(P)H-dependent oxidoreductase subunit E [Anaerolineales bacterium]